MNTLLHRVACFTRFFLLCALAAPALAQIPELDQSLLLEQERERVLRQRNEAERPVRGLTTPAAPDALPDQELPCRLIKRIVLDGELHQEFRWALADASPTHDRAEGRCLGSAGIAILMQRVQHAILSRGYVTTRVLVQPQDLSSGTLTLTVLPGRVRQVRFAEGTPSRATAWNAMPLAPGDLLNLRRLEQGLENFKRLPSVEADFQITPSTDPQAQPGDSDVVISWQQTRPLRASLWLDDGGAKSTGRYQTTLTLAYDHWWTLNDLFYVSFLNSLGSEGAADGSTRGRTAHYAVPFGHWLLSATVSGSDYQQTVSSLAGAVHYSGERSSSELAASRLLYRDGVRRTTATVRAWLQSSNNFVNDAELRSQRRRTAGWELALAHREQLRDALLDASLTWRRGTGAFDALRASEESSGEGTSRMQVLRADAGLSLPFSLAGQRLRYQANWRAQWNRTPLAAPDRFAIGNRYTVRGFDGDFLLSSDRGWVVRQDLGLSVGAINSELYAGVDTGHLGGPSAALLPGTGLTGAVVGLRGGSQRWAWEVFAGTPLKKPEGLRSARVTSGFYLSLNF